MSADIKETIEKIRAYIDATAPGLGETTSDKFVALATYEIEIASAILKDDKADEHIKRAAHIIVGGYVQIVESNSVAIFTFVHMALTDVFKRIAPRLSRGYYDHMKLVRLLDDFERSVDKINTKAAEFVAQRN